VPWTAATARPLSDDDNDSDEDQSETAPLFADKH
jgi:hypothetical protein